MNNTLLNKVERTLKRFEALRSEAAPPPRIIICWCECEEVCTCHPQGAKNDRLIRFKWEDLTT